jgi:hypothetical protein
MNVERGAQKDVEEARLRCERNDLYALETTASELVEEESQHPVGGACRHLQRAWVLLPITVSTVAALTDSPV